MRIGGWLLVAAAIGILGLCDAVFPRRHKKLGDDDRLLVAKPHNLAESKPRLPHNLNVTQYDISIKPYFKADGVTVDDGKVNTFDGETTVTFTMTSPADEIILDAFELNIISLRFLRNGQKMVLKYANFDSKYHRYTIAPIQFLSAGETYSIHFKYTGIIRDYGQGGLFYSTYTNPDGTTGNIYATHFETGVGARSVFPCFDDPHFKAQFNITVIAPKSLTVLSNTKENNGTDLGDGYRSVNFPLTNRQSSYLVAFAIGDLVSVSDKTKDGIEIRAWTWRQSGAFIDTAVHTAKTCVEVMTDFTGISLPLEKLDHLAVPYFAAGGMENWGFIIYAAAYVLYDPAQDDASRYYSGIDVRCHEIAHQWFGDYVTADWWSDIMLHESFASYFEDYTMVNGWTNQSEYVDTEFVRSTTGYGFTVDTFKSHPVITTDGSFDGVVYDKGGALLRMLSATLTPQVFRSGLRNYLTKYAFGNADHNKLWDAMTEIAQQHGEVTNWCGGKMNVSELMNPWITQPHYPIITVAYDNLHQSYQINQQPFVPNASLPTGYQYQWPVPLELRQVNGDLLPRYWSAPLYYCPATKKKGNAVGIPWTSDNPIIVNPDTAAFARVQYDDSTFEKIVNAIETGVYVPSAKALVRLIQDELAIVHRDQALHVPVSYRRTLKIVSAALKSYKGPNPANVFLAADAVINELRSLSLDRSEVELTNEYFSSILTPLYQQTSWDLEDPDSWDEQIFKSALFLRAVKNDIADARGLATARFNKCGANFTTCDSVPIYLQKAVYCAAALTGGNTVGRELVTAIKTSLTTSTSIHSQAAALATGVACSFDESTLNNFILNSVTQFSNFPSSYIGYLSDNSAATQVLYSFLAKRPTSFATKSGALNAAFDVLIANWYTQDRIAQLKTLQSGLTSSLQLYPNAVNTVNEYIAYISAEGPKKENYYAEIIRQLYDAYAPKGEVPWTARLAVSGITDLTYNLTVQPYIPSTSYAFDPLKNFTYDANITIEFSNPTQGLTSIELNSHRQILKSATVNIVGFIDTITVIKIERNFTTAIMNLHLNAAIPKGNRISVQLVYSGFIFDHTPNEGIITNYDYSTVDNLKHWIFATDFEGGPSTRSLAPSFDEPNFKGRWTVNVIHPTEYTALSNTLESSISILGGGLTRTVFKQTNLMSSYLLALTVGQYSTVQATANNGNILIRIQSWKGTEQYAQTALNFAVNTINYLSSTLNVSQPLEKIDILALPQYSGYASGAMENWGLVIAGYRDVLIHPQYTSAETIRNAQNTISHELTHQWFGDLVTMDWWTDLFLNEAFATYWPPLVLRSDPAGDADSVSYMQLRDLVHGLELDDTSSWAHPVVPKVSDVSQSWGLFSGSVYDKGSSILRTMANVLGEEALNAGLSAYLTAFSFGNPTDFALLRFLDAAAKEYNIPGWTSSPVSVTDFLEPYLRQWSAPLITVTTTSTGIRLSQQPLVDSTKLPSSEFGYLWKIPLRIFSAPTNNNQIQWLTTQSSTITLPDHSVVLVDSDAKTHARVNYDTASWHALSTILDSQPNVFTPEAVAKLIIDQYALAQNHIVPWERFLNATTLLANDSNFMPWYLSIVDWIPTLAERLRFSDIEADYKIYLSYLLKKNTVTTLAAGSTWAANSLNPRILEFKLALGDAKVWQAVSDAFVNFTTSCQYQVLGTGYCNPITPDYRRLQFIYGLKNNPTKLPAVQAFYNYWTSVPQADTYFSSDASALLEALAASGDVTTIRKLIVQALSGTTPIQFLTSVAEHDDTGLILFNYLKDYPNVVKTSQNFYNFLSAMTSTWTTDAQADQLANFDWKLSSGQQSAVNGLLTDVRSRAAWVDTHGPAISAWLKTFNAAHAN
uniref:Aminopeptidase n=1 Tax=Panagrellus redivivus TaxID=6233 RepID=A0A7E4UT57_PANRE